jgi:hypothetical protein
MRLNEEQKISLEDLYSYLNQEKEYLRHRKENTKWFYILTGAMVLIFYLDGFNEDKYVAVVGPISACWFIALLFMKEHFWDHENLKFTREAIARNYKVLAKYGTYAFLNDDTNGLTVTQKDDNTLYDFQKLLDKDEPSPEQTQRFLDELGRKIKEDDKVDDPTNVVKFNKADKKTGYIIYYQEIQTSKKLLKPEIKILKSDMTKLRQTLISKQIDELVKLYPLEYFNKFRFYLMSQDIPFITRMPFVKQEGRMVIDFKPNGSSHNYYEAENGELSKPTEEQLDWRIYSGVSGKKKVKLKIVK